jgi:cytochrome c
LTIIMGGRMAMGAVLIAACALAATTTVTWVHDRAQADGQKKGAALVKNNDCLSCHAIDHKVVGPAFTAVAKRYAGQKAVVAKLVAKVRSGGSGNWGTVAMTPHPNLSTSDLTSMVEWVLSLKASSKPASSNASLKQYTYALGNGKKVTLDFPVFVRDHEVTSSVFHGWQLFDAYCFRCHGPDAVGGELAPDLRVSLEQGMTKGEFIATAMAGRKGKGMPSWAGFFSAEEITHIYQYVKARSVELVPAGRPAGE